jgi:ketosteroid isomerase-like protein
MSAQNLELVRKGYEAWNRHDLDAVARMLHPDVSWHGYSHVPEPGELRGREEVRRWLERFLEVWGELEIELIEVTDAGEQVVALVRFKGRGSGSGIEVESGVDAHVWTIRDRKVTSVRLFQGTREALEAVGNRS